MGNEIDVHVGIRMRDRRESDGKIAAADADEDRFDFREGPGSNGDDSSDPLDLIWVVVGGTVTESGSSTPADPIFDFTGAALGPSVPDQPTFGFSGSSSLGAGALPDSPFDFC